MPSIPAYKQQRSQAFKQADENGDAILPQQWGHVVGLLQNAMDNVDPQENPQTAEIMAQLNALLVESRPMSFQQMDGYREALEGTGEPAAEKLVDIIDKSLESMGSVNPNMKEAVTATKGLRRNAGLMKLLKAALAYKEQDGTDMLSAVKRAVGEVGVGGLPVEDRKMVQNMLLTGDSSEFISMLDNDAGGQDAVLEMEPKRFG